MSKTVSIIQSAYLPWKGYFDIIRKSDVFVFLDCVKFSKNSWRNRNKIKTKNGARWLTVPVRDRESTMLISEVEIATDSNWQEKHCKLIEDSYRNTPYYGRYSEFIHELFAARIWSSLSELNIYAIRELLPLLGISTPTIRAEELDPISGASERVLDICLKLGATRYLSGPAAKDYLNLELFREKGIEVVWAEYQYAEYPQLYPPFVHEVSVLDLLCNVGPRVTEYFFAIRSFPHYLHALKPMYL